MLAGAVALAAGRFQPLVRLDRITRYSSSGESSVGSRFESFRDVLSLAEARRFAHMIEARAATLTGTYNRLGDHCDFLTLAGDWPYRYSNDAEGGVVRGEHALDDLIGRLLETNEGGLRIRDLGGRSPAGCWETRPPASIAPCVACFFSLTPRCCGTPTTQGLSGRITG